MGPVYSLTFDFCGSTNEEGFLVAAVEAGASTAAVAEWSPGFFYRQADVRRVRASANVRLMNLFPSRKFTISSHGTLR